MMNPLSELQKQGQSIWLDYISRGLIASGSLRSMIENDGLRGVTSNPSIFEKAIDAGSDYDARIAELVARNPEAGAKEIYDELVIEDVRDAADALRLRYEESGGADGFVSLEPPPQLTRDTAATLVEARRLWQTVSRPNLMIKVVATPEGVKAVETLISEGINVNITLMFSMRHYEAVTSAYVRGLERCSRPERVASVASFFVSRVDTQVDKALEANGSSEALALGGRIAIANARLVYRRFGEIFHGDTFSTLRNRGARVQRPLWASTSTKNPHYRDVLYVEELIGPETVNTLPLATLEAFRDHGRVRGATVLESWPDAEQDLGKLANLGIDLNAITERLQIDGIASFAEAYGKVMAALERKRNAVVPARRFSGGGSH
jgi:transaldolase